MNADMQESGIAAVIVERLETQRLPRALDLKAKVDQGEVLDEMDIEFLERVLGDANALRPLIDRHPEYQALAVQMIDLYHDIISRALENETPSKAS